ncbi:reverse transcriptase, partial [Tanacetum coccineum]
MGDVRIEKVDTDDNLVDPFTKALAFPKHSELTKKIGMIPARTYVEEDGDLLLSDEGVVNTFHSLVDEQPLISLNALSGVNTYRTIRVKGCMGRNALHVLVDSGSIHNFLDLQIAKKLGCMLRRICPLDVFVANGNVITSIYECKGLTWVCQGVTYTTDVMILPLGGCDMVLGIQCDLKGYSTNYYSMQGKQKNEGGENIADFSAVHAYVYPVALLNMEINNLVPKSVATVLK